MTLQAVVKTIQVLLDAANNSNVDGSEREAQAYSRVLALLATVRKGEE